ncbi:ABC transporter substrate-binding protein [Microlunatus parietis]|uniref:ABC-type glycerol-3-phosphate transport system substrate-binding protein n=1 Tax=Microlunatus parietis TaxID=682979 RepID=A0A7Y9I3U6_9ACTN|nr:extracellular solute-binding protein [Microlunatus parietis]NYE69729.1 ABC-type glycerol-3-phosphate transport system substrate-binding protein [Microlunatus parietis]
MSSVRNDLDQLRRLRGQLVAGDISRRGFLTAAMGLSSAALLTACGGGLTQQPAGGSSERGGDPNVVPLYTVENDPATLAFYNMVIAKFEKDHPGKTVKVTVYADANQLQYLTTAFQNNVDVGIFSPAVSSFSDFQQAGHLAELDDLVEEIGKDDFLPGTRIVIGGHDYGIPLQSNSSLVYYRKDLLDAAGLPVPTSYDEYLNAVKALHQRDGENQVGIAMAVGATAQLPLQFFAPYIYQSGWDYFDTEGKLTFDQPEVRDAVRRFTDIMKYAPKSLYNAAYGDIVTIYSAGQAAFATFPGRLGVTIDDRAAKVADNTGVMPIPAGPFMTGQLHFGSGQQYGLYARTSDPDLAKDFLRRLTTGEDALAFALTVPGHLLPPMKSVLKLMQDKIAGATEGYLAKRKEWLQTFIEQVPNAMTSSVSMGAVTAKTFDGKILNMCPWAPDIWPSPPLDGTMFQDILLKGESVDAAWQKTAKLMGEKADAWRAKNPDWKPEVSR